MLGEVVDSLLMYIMGDDKPGLVLALVLIEVLIEYLFRALNGVWAVMAVVFGIDVVENDMVPEISHVTQAAGIRGAARIRGTHVGGEIAKNIPKCHFIPQKLSSTLDLGDLVEVLMRPGMTRYLMSADHHSLDERRPWYIRAINLTFAIVVPGDEEGDFRSVFIQEVEKVASVLVGTIIVGQSNGSGGSAMANLGWTVQSAPKLGASNPLR
jgi:hypothetical protein